MLKLFYFCLFIFCFVKIAAQNNFSFSNDNYSGINSVVLSPTQAFLDTNPWDVNLISADIFLQNNYAYISKQNVLGLLNAEIQVANPRKNIRGEGQSNVFDFYNKETADALMNYDALGPSFSMIADIKEKKYAFGLFSRMRVQGAVLKLDNYFRFGNEMVPQPSDYKMNPFSSAAMSWNEVGLNAATEIFPYSDKHWILGVNIKYEMGLDAANIISHKDIDLSASDPAPTEDPDYKNIYASNYDISLNYITNYDFENDRYEYKQNGSGLGLDIGITMMDKDKGEDEYNSKFSLNILDIGSVSFKQGINHSFKNGKTVWLQNNPVFKDEDFTTPEDYLRKISKEAYGNEDASFVGNGFRIGLPTSINVNYSQRVKANHFINFNWIQRVPFFRNPVKRNNMLNANYSVQKEAIGYGVSTSLSEYRHLYFGGYLRLGPVILGSENIFPMFFKHQHLHAAAFYLAIKLYPFWDNEFKRHRREKCDCEK
ncbi:MAG: hypothetical protein E2590_01405 [Chryseobacterium sp.]|nr:hypothetical protein [Chryseobacterium sp.]